MEKTIINNMYAMLPQVLALAKKSVWFDYDKKADVLYVSFRRPQDATETVPFNENILLRQRGNEMVGLTILHASKIVKAKLPLDK